MAEGLQLVISNDGIATVRMNNKENRFRLSFVKAWMNILDEIEANEAIKGLMIIGNEKYFSLGLDIEYFQLQTPEYVAETKDAIGSLYIRLLLLPVPTVAVINGHAFGAGAFLTLACDYRVMRSDRGWLCWPEVNLNMRMRPLSYQLISLKFSESKAVRDAVLFGKRLSANKAKEFSLVDIATTDDNLLSEAINQIKSALGPRGIDRRALKQMKMDLYGASISKL